MDKQYCNDLNVLLVIRAVENTAEYHKMEFVRYLSLNFGHTNPIKLCLVTNLFLSENVIAQEKEREREYRFLDIHYKDF